MKLDIYVQPGAKKSGFAGEHGGRPKIRISAPPAGGAANNEICLFMARALGLPKTKIKITSGLSSRLKTLDIDANLTAEHIKSLLLDMK